MMQLRKRFPAVLCITFFAVPVGCGDVDWDWESRWWDKPTRRVQPDGEQRQPGRARDGSGQGRERVARADDDRPSDSSASTSSMPPAAESDFYQLYLQSEPSSMRGAANVERVSLAHQSARSAARMLELLYLPVGTGGAEHQHYLIYQERRAWESAAKAAALLDVPPAEESSGAESAYRQGVRLFAEIVERGAAPPREMLNEARTSLTQAAQSSGLDRGRRWAAAILGGHIAADYQYEYDSARGLYRLADEMSEPGSLEQLASWWGQVECLNQSGDTRGASALCERIVTTFADYPRAQAVRRAEAYRKARAGR
jgi:hypothetical protein